MVYASPTIVLNIDATATVVNASKHEPMRTSEGAHMLNSTPTIALNNDATATAVDASNQKPMGPRTKHIALKYNQSKAATATILIYLLLERSC